MANCSRSTTEGKKSQEELKSIHKTPRCHHVVGNGYIIVILLAGDNDDVSRRRDSSSEKKMVVVFRDQREHFLVTRIAIICRSGKIGLS